MSQTPTIDVIIPAHNAAKTIVETLNSVLKQTYPVKTIFVVDDGSKDDTVERVNHMQHPNIVVLSHDANRGVCAARNTGLNNPAPI